MCTRVIRGLHENFVHIIDCPKGPYVLTINSFSAISYIALHREPLLSLKSVFCWASILRARSFFPLYRGKCHTKYVSTNSYDEIRFNDIFLFPRTDDTLHAPKTRFATDFCIVLILTLVFFGRVVFMLLYSKIKRKI